MKILLCAIIMACLILIAGCEKNDPASDTTIENMTNETVTTTTEPVSSDIDMQETLPEDSDLSLPFSYDYDGEMTITFSFGTLTGHYIGRINDDSLPDGEGSFSAKDENNVIWIYTGSWKGGHMEGSGVSTWTTGYEYTGTYLNDLENGHGVLRHPSGYTIEGEFLSGELIGEGSVHFSDGTSFTGVFTDTKNATGIFVDLDSREFAATFEDGVFSVTPPDDFFTDVEHQKKYNELYKSYRYKELYEYISTYISETNPIPSDNAYTILDMIEPALPYESKWKAVLDEYDGNYLLSFPGTESISGSNSVSVSLMNTDLEIKIGFRRSGWLFFDHIGLSSGGEEVYRANVESSAITRTVISGSTIEEYCFCSFYDDVLNDLGQAENVILRFENKKSGEILDHKLSQTEIDAMYCGYILRVCNRDLSNLVYRYNKASEGD